MDYKKRSLRNTGEFFLLAPAISNPKYAPVNPYWTAIHRMRTLMYGNPYWTTIEIKKSKN